MSQDDDFSSFAYWSDHRESSDFCKIIADKGLRAFVSRASRAWRGHPMGPATGAGRSPGPRRCEPERDDLGPRKDPR